MGFDWTAWLRLYFKAIVLAGWSMSGRGPATVRKQTRRWLHFTVKWSVQFGLNYQNISNKANRIKGQKGSKLGSWLSLAHLPFYEVAFCALNLSASMIYDCMQSSKLRFVWLSVSIKVTIIAIFLFFQTNVLQSTATQHLCADHDSD